MKQTTIECLERIGYPTDLIMLDFESYFDDEYTLKDSSTIEYVTDSRWELLGCGFQILSPYGDTPAYFKDKEELEAHLMELWYQYGRFDGDEVTIVAKNGKFDFTILKHHYGMVPKYMLDLDDLLRFYDARMRHKLKDVVKLFGLKEKGDTMKFKGLTFDMICDDPAAYDYLADYTINDIERQVELLEIVFPLIDFTEDEAALARHTHDLFLNPQFRVDRERATKVRLGMQLELARIIKNYAPKLLGSDIRLANRLGALLAEHGEKLPLKLKGTNKKTGKQCIATKNMLPQLQEFGGETPDGAPLEHCGPTFAKDDDGCKWLQAHTDPQISELVKARIAVKSWPTHIKKVTGIMDQATCGGSDMLRVPLTYYGCHTGRPSGGEGINLLNLGGKGRGTPIHSLISQVRGILQPPKGRLLCIVDSEQIEPRLLAWMAGQQDMLDAFANGEDLYSDFASDLFQSRVWKWDDKVDVEEYPGQKTQVEIWRGFGKDNIIGDGYGLGGRTAYARCLQNPFLRPRFDSGEYDFKTVQKGVDLYRSKYNHIPKFWTRMEKCWGIAARIKNQAHPIKIPGTPSCITFTMEDNSVMMKLPSGRRIRYRNARYSHKHRTIKFRHGHLWGGTLTENADQAIARDLLCYWILKALRDKDYDFNIVLYPYDEIVADVPEKYAEEHLARLQEIMTSKPDWARGLPLSTDHKIADRYLK
ncbi:MAG TPA: hypothetical protein ENH62_08095 [Marinobacter sp.]|nr:hypothetical protein [Marinobacter sp.]